MASLEFSGAQVARRFWAKVDQRGPEECWLWTAAKNADGYGVFSIGGRKGQYLGAHRVSYSIAVGPIPDGLVIDHLCRNPACVNPAHLDAVTMAENTRRGLRHALQREEASRRTHCDRGHEYTDHDKDWRGHRACRQCQRDSAEAWRCRNRDRVNLLRRQRAHAGGVKPRNSANR